MPVFFDAERQNDLSEKLSLILKDIKSAQKSDVKKSATVSIPFNDKYLIINNNIIDNKDIIIDNNKNECKNIIVDEIIKNQLTKMQKTNSEN